MATLATTLLAACGKVPGATPGQPGEPASPGDPPGQAQPAPAQPWQPRGEDFSSEAPAIRTTLNQVRFLIDGPEIFPAMERMIQGARRQVEVDYFVFSGKQGMRLAQLLAAKARSGVRVDVTFDPGKGFTPMFTRAANTVIATLKAGSVNVHAFPVNRLPRRYGINKVVDHNKVVVVDRQVAMVGGMNIADVFARNHDVMLQIRGPAAADVGRMIASDRSVAAPLEADSGSRPAPTEPIAPPEDLAPPFSDSLVPVRILSTGINRRGYKEVLLDQIRRAEKSVHALMFQLVDEDVIEALIEARKRGVDVRVILDPGDHDELIPIIKKAPRGFPNLPIALQLLKAGVPVRWYRLDPDQVEMHAKVGIIDGRVLLAGSTNWIPSAFLYNNEMSLLVEGGAAVERSRSMFESDWASKADPVKDRGVTQDLLSWIIDLIPYL